MTVSESDILAAKNRAIKCLWSSCDHRINFCIFFSEVKQNLRSDSEILARVDEIKTKMSRDIEEFKTAFAKVKDTIVIASSQLNRPITIFPKINASTAHEGALISAVALHRAMTIYQGRARHGAAVMAEAIWNDLATQNIAYENLDAEILIEFGRAVARLGSQPSLSAKAVPATEEMILHSVVMEKLDLSTKTVNRYAKGAGVPTPHGRSHRYKITDVVKICKFAEASGTKETREKANAWKVELLSKINGQLAN